MKIPKEQAKLVLKTFLLTLLSYFIFLILSIPIFNFAYRDMVKTDKTHSTSFFDVPVYKMNDQNNLISFIIFLVAYALFSTLIIKKLFFKIYKINALFDLLFIVLIFVFLVALIILFMLTTSLSIGVLASSESKYDFTLIEIIFPPCYTLVDFAIGIIKANDSKL